MAIRFRTASATAVPGTAVVGRVLASDPESSPDGTHRDRPLADVTSTVFGVPRSTTRIGVADGPTSHHSLQNQWVDELEVDAFVAKQGPRS